MRYVEDEIKKAELRLSALTKFNKLLDDGDWNTKQSLFDNPWEDAITLSKHTVLTLNEIATELDSRKYNNSYLGINQSEADFYILPGYNDSNLGIRLSNEESNYISLHFYISEDLNECILDKLGV